MAEENTSQLEVVLAQARRHLQCLRAPAVGIDDAIKRELDRARESLQPLQRALDQARLTLKITFKMAMETDMPARDPIKLEFGDQTFEIRQMSMSQIVELVDLFGEAGAEQSQTDRMKLARGAIEIALKRDHGSINVDDLDCDAQDLPEQVLAIMNLAGIGPGTARASQA